MGEDAAKLCREGLLHLANGRVDEAIASYRSATEADPAMALGWNGLSRACREKGDVDAAIEAARRVAELEPDDPLSHTNLSILYQLKGMIQEAEDEKAIATRLEFASRSGG